MAIDRELLRTRLGNDEALLRDTLGDFLQLYPEMVSSLRSAIEACTALEVRRRAHSLKTVAATFGAEEARAAALKLEQRGRSNELDGAAADYDVLAAQFEQLAAEVRVWLAALSGNR